MILLSPFFFVFVFAFSLYRLPSTVHRLLTPLRRHIAGWTALPLRLPHLIERDKAHAHMHMTGCAHGVCRPRSSKVRNSGFKITCQAIARFRSPGPSRAPAHPPTTSAAAHIQGIRGACTALLVDYPLGSESASSYVPRWSYRGSDMHTYSRHTIVRSRHNGILARTVGCAEAGGWSPRNRPCSQLAQTPDPENRTRQASGLEAFPPCT